MGKRNHGRSPCPPAKRRNEVISEMCQAVAMGVPPAHGGRWGKANLEVCLAVIESARERQDMFLSHQTTTLG